MYTAGWVGSGYTARVAVYCLLLGTAGYCWLLPATGYYWLLATAGYCLLPSFTVFYRGFASFMLDSSIKLVKPSKHLKPGYPQLKQAYSFPSRDINDRTSRNRSKAVQEQWRTKNTRKGKTAG